MSVDLVEVPHDPDGAGGEVDVVDVETAGLTPADPGAEQQCDEGPPGLRDRLIQDCELLSGEAHHLVPLVIGEVPAGIPARVDPQPCRGVLHRAL